MFRHTLCSLAVAAALAGCAVTAPAPPSNQLPWQDARFHYDARLVSLTSEDIFRLDPELAAMLADPKVQYQRALPRAKFLLTTIFGPERDRFRYEAGHSTIASESWRRHRGDCISLTVLTYAAAKALKLDAEIQEVYVPAMYVRRSGFEYVNHHVNLTVRIPPIPGAEGLRQLVVDFDPDVTPGQKGQVLREPEVVARMYNNLATEFLTEGDTARAYAYLKAAILNDGALAPAYANLALLYRRDGLDTEAEQLLRQAIALSTQPATAMRALVELLEDKGRTEEARAVAEQLRRREERDPYYWIDRGTRELADGHPAGAAHALERAQELAEGFAEVHRQLAIAYWQLGKGDQMREQLALLAQSENGGPVASRLKHKLLHAQ